MQTQLVETPDHRERERVAIPPIHPFAQDGDLLQHWLKVPSTTTRKGRWNAGPRLREPSWRVTHVVQEDELEHEVVTGEFFRQRGEGNLGADPGQRGAVQGFGARTPHQAELRHRAI